MKKISILHTFTDFWICICIGKTMIYRFINMQMNYRIIILYMHLKNGSIARFAKMMDKNTCFVEPGMETSGGIKEYSL